MVISLGKVCTLEFSFLEEIYSRADWDVKTWYGKRSWRRKILDWNLSNSTNKIILLLYQARAKGLRKFIFNTSLSLFFFRIGKFINKTSLSLFFPIDKYIYMTSFSLCVGVMKLYKYWLCNDQSQRSIRRHSVSHGERLRGITRGGLWLGSCRDQDVRP